MNIAKWIEGTVDINYRSWRSFGVTNVQTKYVIVEGLGETGLAVVIIGLLPSVINGYMNKLSK